MSGSRMNSLCRELRADLRRAILLMQTWASGRSAERGCTRARMAFFGCMRLPDATMELPRLAACAESRPIAARYEALYSADVHAN